MEASSSEDSTSLRHKSGREGLLSKAANTCSPFSGHNREVKLQPQPPASPRDPTHGTQLPQELHRNPWGTAEGSLGWSLAPTHSMPRAPLLVTSPDVSR